MSGFVSEPVRTDEHQVATSSHGNSDHSPGHRHDISSKGAGSGNSVTMNDLNDAEVEMDISAGQKMLSAVSGSLLTSLLGIFFLQRPKKSSLLMCVSNSHTSRCRPSTSAISTPDLEPSYPKALLEFHKSSSKCWSHSVLPRSLLGKQHISILYRSQSFLNGHSYYSESIHIIHISSSRLRRR